MQWAVGLTTAPRPEPTLERTRASLQKAGWPDFHVFDDVGQAGAWRNWIEGLGELIRRHPDADAYLMAQDDAIFCRRLRAYLEKTLWPAPDVALCSPYCPTPYRRRRRGWHEESHGWNLIGAVCWVLPPRSAQAIVAKLSGVEASRRIDARIGQWAAGAGRSVWYHTPSLVQHGGVGNSALGDENASDLRIAADFLGEDAEP